MNKNWGFLILQVLHLTSLHVVIESVPCELLDVMVDHPHCTIVSK